MIVLIALLSEIATPIAPLAGFAIDYDGTALAPKLVDEKVRLARYRIESGKLVEVKTYDHVFDGMLQIMVTKDGIIVGDYESGNVLEMDRAGAVRWRAKTRYPTMLRGDTAGHVWAVFNSGYIMRKTPDSSEFEHVLQPNGLEVTEDFCIDIVPVGDGTFYTVQEDGELRFYGADRKRVTLGKVPTERMILSKLGGVVSYYQGTIRHVSRSGAVRVLTQLKPQVARGIMYFARSPDGRLMIGKATDSGGLIIFLDPNIEK